jgi:hypothetical protein
MPSTSLFRLAVLAAAASALGACTLFGGPQDRALRRTPSFKDGYADGCAAAQEQGSDFRGNTVRDDDLYKNDAVYRRGWASGWQTCAPIERRQETTPGSNPLPGPTH